MSRRPPTQTEPGHRTVLDPSADRAGQVRAGGDRAVTVVVVPARFRDRIRIDPSGCWVWTGAKTVRIDGGRDVQPHSAVHYTCYGVHASRGRQLVRTCGTDGCVHPDHREYRVGQRPVPMPDPFEHHPRRPTDEAFREGARWAALTLDVWLRRYCPGRHQAPTLLTAARIISNAVTETMPRTVQVPSHVNDPWAWAWEAGARWVLGAIERHLATADPDRGVWLALAAAGEHTENLINHQPAGGTP